MDAHRPRSERSRFLRRADEGRHSRRLGGGEEVATPVEPEHVVALHGQLLEEIDAPVHEGDHVVARTRPPVAIAFGGFVAREGERWPLVHDDDVAHASTHGQVIGGGHARDARAADYDLRGQPAHVACQHTSTRNLDASMTL